MSDRLRLREFRESDLDVVGTMVADPEQMTFYPRPKMRDEASAWLRRNRALHRERGFGFWLIELPAASRFAGYCGIRPLELEAVAEIEIGWHVHRRSWRRGVATRAAAIARDAAASRFGIPRLVALVHPDHSPCVGSRRTSGCMWSGRRSLKRTIRRWCTR
jgi:RimJ/RimL family protein N-acetyltransferase